MCTVFGYIWIYLDIFGYIWHTTKPASFGNKKWGSCLKHGTWRSRWGYTWEYNHSCKGPRIPTYGYELTIIMPMKLTPTAPPNKCHAQQHPMQVQCVSWKICRITRTHLTVHRPTGWSGIRSAWSGLTLSAELNP